MALLPPPSLAGIVRYFHIECASGGTVLIPATPCPEITFFIAGGSRLMLGTGLGPLLARPMLGGPQTVPALVHWEAGTTFISALIEPGQFGRLFDADLVELRNVPVLVEEYLPHLPIRELEDGLRASDDPHHWLTLLSDWLLSLLARRADRIRPAFELPPGMLFQPTEDIARRCGLSVRQLERGMLASYGQSLRDERKMRRYVRALSMMLSLPPRRGLLTRIAVDCGYHDQAHMIRDFIHFTGQRPGSLLALEGGEEEGGLLRLFHYDDPHRQVVTGQI
ncbi:AraC family transcriptional regulator [Massilia sp. BJB1822]|uniref:helix-turn-helix domain-containing protein n=1 Tax=Massilia sp. BJB1822 TaxID=2744470 RepID=UPI001593E581|nr:AraC family transcriptional regulator [Massilia sp. BJB1822]NVD99169.1 helix-turn-helix transcriptional regulator [Massilia sp. BJB1822]